MKCVEIIFSCLIKGIIKNNEYYFFKGGNNVDQELNTTVDTCK